jgi:L-fuculose-phosphate aldolase
MDKEAIKAGAITGMRKAFPAESWSIREKVALACRILSDAGHDSGLAGQITARTATDTFITQRFGLGFEETAVSNLLTVNAGLEVLAGEGMPNPANRFHTWIYRTRPDVRCVVHTHPTHVSALSMLEIPLVISHMDSCILFDEVALLPRWPGIPVGDCEGELISAALGRKKAALLAHHGLVAAGASVAEACIIALQIERAARLQLLAMPAGEIRPLAGSLASEARGWLLEPTRIEATFAYYARRILQHSPACLK